MIYKEMKYATFKANLLSWHPLTAEEDIKTAYNKYKYEINKR